MWASKGGTCEKPAWEGDVTALPARCDGPHCWLWRLLYEEAERRLIEGRAAGDRIQLVGHIWESIVDGALWVRRDRSGVREDQPDPWLRELVLAEARRHVELSARLDRAVAAYHPDRKAKDGRPIEERVTAISLFLWRLLGNGWARVADEEDALVFWDPRSSSFVPFSLELSRAYVSRYGS